MMETLSFSVEKGDVGVEGSCDMLPRRQRERAKCNDQNALSLHRTILPLATECKP